MIALQRFAGTPEAARTPRAFRGAARAAAVHGQPCHATPFRASFHPALTAGELSLFLARSLGYVGVLLKGAERRRYKPLPMHTHGTVGRQSVPALNPGLERVLLLIGKFKSVEVP